jgi:hypothetical protein
VPGSDDPAAWLTLALVVIAVAVTASELVRYRRKGGRRDE